MVSSISITKFHNRPAYNLLSQANPADHAPSETPGQDFSRMDLQLLVAPSVPSVVAARLLSVSLVTLPLSLTSLRRTVVIGFSAQPLVQKDVFI